MRLKLRIISCAIAFAFSLCLAITSLPTDSWLSWRIGTIKSELWAASQRFDPDFESEKIATGVEPTLMSSIFPNRNGTDESMENNDFFPLGWYDSVGNLDTPAQIATEGIDFIVPYTGKSDATKVKAYLDRAAAVGIKVMVEIPRLEVRRDHRWLITHQFVKALKNHPAVYGWYLYDEPEFTQISPALLKRVYDAIKTEDPNHTVAIAFGRLERVKPYLQALDTLIYFRYPCYYDSPEFCGFEDGSFKDLAAEAAAFAQRGNFWMALQGYGEDKYGKTQNNRRLPSLEEERYMIYSAVLAPANGLLFWTHYRSQQQWIDGVLTPLIEELREYLPAITNRNSVVPKAVSDARVKTKLFRYPQTGDLLLVAINNSGQSFTTEMVLQPRVRVNSAQVKAENRAIAIKEGKLTDVFEPFAVHVYQLQSD